MISDKLINTILSEGKSLNITFAGLPFKNTRMISVYKHHGRFTLTDGRLQCEEMKYSRHISKVILICKGDQVLYGKRCNNCKRAVPKSHGNCFNCYSTSFEQKWKLR